MADPISAYRTDPETDAYVAGCEHGRRYFSRFFLKIRQHCEEGECGSAEYALDRIRQIEKLANIALRADRTMTDAASPALSVESEL